MRYQKQIEILKKICNEYEKEDSNDAEIMQTRFDNISTSLMELMTYGYPPDELIGEAPAGWSLDPSTGFPKVENISEAAQSCTLM